MGHHGNIFTYCPLEHNVCENANVCGVLEIRMPHVPPFPVSFFFSFFFNVYFASQNSFQSSVNHYLTAADSVILIFPENSPNCLDTEEYRGWGLFQQARFAVMGDGSLYPSENHSRWNLKPSLYHKCSKKSTNEGQCLTQPFACVMIV